MLASALFYVVLIALLTLTILSGTLAMTRATVQRLAQTYIATGYQRAAASLQQTLAADEGVVPYPLPTFTPIPASCVDSKCRYTTSETITLTLTATPVPAASCNASESNCAANVQENSYVTESRITARINVTVNDAAGTQLVARSGDVIVRTTKTAPYASIAGSRDGSFDDIIGTNTAGDDGGAPPSTPNPCTSPSPSDASDTTVRVEYNNTTTSACTDGSQWESSSYGTSGSAPSGWSP